jgi:hypothetical protein
VNDRFRPPLHVLWRESHASSAVLASLAASVPAAIVSGLLLLLLDGPVFLRIGSIVVDPAPGRDAWLAAVVTHLALSALFSVVFGILVAFTAHHLTPVAGAAWGAFFGLVVWLVWFVLLLPSIHRELSDATRLGLLYHVVFGATMGALFHFARIHEKERHQIT